MGRTTFRLREVLGGLVILILLTGCGSSEGTSTQGEQTVDVYVTDSFRDDYSHVQVTLFRIEASSDGQTFQTLYEDPDGQTLDLTSLANAAQLLGSVNVPGDDFTQVHVVFADHILLSPRAGGPSQSVPVEDHPPLVISADGRSTVTLQAHTERASDRLSNLVIDFDLSAFELVSGHVRPSLRPGDPGQFSGKQRIATLAGTVSGLSTTGFDLTSPNGQRSLSVTITDSTSVSNVSSGADATLANGQSVVAHGIVDPATRVLTADVIRILDRPLPAPMQGAIGTIASVDSAGLRFDLTVRDSLHFAPAAGAIHVQTETSTMFHAPGRRAATFADVSVGRSAAVIGTFDAASQTLHARRVELLPARP